jgi:hypothetical protein
MLLPIGETAEFRIHKDKILLRVMESDDKVREYLVVFHGPANGRRTEPVRIGARCSLAIPWLPTWVRFELGLRN